MTDTPAPLVFHCPWGSTGVVGDDQRIHPVACATESWTDPEGLIEHLLEVHGGLRGWQRPAAEREVESQRQAWIDAQAPAEADADCGAMYVLSIDGSVVATYTCQLKVHAGDHRYTDPDDAMTLTWRPEE